MALHPSRCPHLQWQFLGTTEVLLAAWSGRVTPCSISTAVAGYSRLAICAGGPAMIRAAAKNHADVCVVVDPADYEPLLQHLGGDVNSSEAQTFRRRLAWKAFQHCSSYDSAVSEWLWTQIGVAVLPRCSMHPHPAFFIAKSMLLSCKKKLVAAAAAAAAATATVIENCRHLPL